MGSSFFGVADKYLGETNVPVSSGQVRIERQRPLEFGNALVRALVWFRMPPMISWASASFGL